MQLVIDTSAIIAVITNEAQKEALVQATAGAELVAPASVPWEIGNAFSAMLKRKRIDLAQATLAMAAFRQIPIRFMNIDLDAALAVAARYDVYAYDAYMIACAREQGCPLLTLDRGLVHAAKQANVTVAEVPQ
ncbi:type II toxin-antitoxin system VapC family toxin [Longimicrobium sp.]|jgi:predicted nucleic acid-binding protein|uniref:type II toxin-antitoxin system VapC family toxin n=1 Tax=Longimicrobium sp. TaxID=2029185 RepID=UPI002ED78C35